jgi:DNA-binding response OmpR family regulator
MAGVSDLRTVGGTGSRPKVLVAEREALLRWVIAETLRDRYGVMEADSVEAARAALARTGGSLALVVIDLGLRDGTGFDLLRQVRSMCPTCPVIVILPFREPRLEAEVRNQGAAVLHKPFDVSDIATLARVLPYLQQQTG